MCRDPKNNVRKHGHIQCRNVVVVDVDVDVVQLLFVLFIFNIFFLELLRTFFFLELFSIVYLFSKAQKMHCNSIEEVTMG